METRNSNFDIVRAVAIFMVICIHSLGLVNDALTTGDEEARMTNAAMTIVYGGVPLFVMLSGALLLRKDEPIGVLLYKNIICKVSKIKVRYYGKSFFPYKYNSL